MAHLIQFNTDAKVNVLNESILSTLWRTIQHQQTSVALTEVQTGLTVTYGQFQAKAEEFARRLLSHGCCYNDVIGLFAPNSIDFMIFASAVWRIGAIPALINCQLTVSELEYQLRTCKADYLYTSKDLAVVATQAASKVEYKLKKVFINGPNVENTVDISRHSSTDVSQRLPPMDTLNKELDNPAIIMFSGGTTGLQKAILLSQRNMQAEFAIARQQPIKLLGPGHQPYLTFAPFTHMTGFMLTFVELLIGDNVYLMTSFHLETFLKTIQEQKIERALIVPPIATMMVKNAESKKFELDSLQDLVVGAAPLSAELEDQLLRRYKNLKQVRQVYGLTETCGCVSGVPLNSETVIHKRKPGTAGIPAPGVKMKVIDIKTGETLGPYANGEVCIKAPLVMIGYLNNPEATAQTIRDGWLHSGDIGYFDNDGYLFIVDRLKELIKYNAHQVAPAELEAILLSHNDVQDAAVVGLPDAKCGELPLAWVVRKPQATITEQQLQTYVNEKVAPFKRLRGGVQFVPSIPKTGSGKILRRDIKAALMKTKL